MSALPVVSMTKLAHHHLSFLLCGLENRRILGLGISGSQPRDFLHLELEERLICIDTLSTNDAGGDTALHALSGEVELIRHLGREIDLRNDCRNQRRERGKQRSSAFRQYHVAWRVSIRAVY
jgi:hypothetical protein